MFDFRGVRLDWFRLQAYTSVSRAGLVLRDHQDLGKHLNMIVFHTKLVDYLDELINETGDLSIYWWLCRSIILMASFFFLWGEGTKNPTRWQLLINEIKINKVINQIDVGYCICLLHCSFYHQIFEHQFKQCMEFPAQHRFSIVFPIICGHFMNATHELCPEEVSIALSMHIYKFIQNESISAHSFITYMYIYMLIRSMDILMATYHGE